MCSCVSQATHLALLCLKAKFRVPRNLELCKANEGLWRPQMHCACCIAHGVCESYYISDQDVPKDANAEATLICRGPNLPTKCDLTSQSSWLWSCCCFLDELHVLACSLNPCRSTCQQVQLQSVLMRPVAGTCQAGSRSTRCAVPAHFGRAGWQHNKRDEKPNHAHVQKCSCSGWGISFRANRVLQSGTHSQWGRSTVHLC